MILVCVDGSDSGRRAVDRAGEIALERNEPVIVLQVIPSSFDREAISQLESTSGHTEIAFARASVDAGVEALAKIGVKAEALICHGDPVRLILEQIEMIKPSVVVAGSRTQDELIPEGSVAKRLGTHTDVPLETVR